MIGRTEDIDHTADMGFKAWAETLEELFVVCAGRMFALILPEGKHYKFGELQRFTFKVAASALEILLRDWLAELLYLHFAHRVYFISFETRIAQNREYTLEAEVLSVPMSSEMIEDAAEIKAVTYHGLRVVRNESGYEAQIIFDV